MGAFERTKGANGEREFARLIHEHLGVRMQRRLRQYQSGGCDLDVHPDDTGLAAGYLANCSIECKRAAKVTQGVIDAWWHQAVEQADRECMPVLAYKGDRQPWRVRLPMDALGDRWPADAVIDVDFNDFALIVREMA